MSCIFYQRSVRKLRFSKPALFFIFTFILILALGWAGNHVNPTGDEIKDDIVAPAGGVQSTDGGSNMINATAGQCTAGVSHSSSGSMFYHGVRHPVFPSTGTTQSDGFIIY